MDKRNFMFCFVCIGLSLEYTIYAERKVIGHANPHE